MHEVVPDRRLVGERQVPEHQVRDPERKRDERMREHAQRVRPAAARAPAAGAARSARRAGERREVAEQMCWSMWKKKSLLAELRDRRDERRAGARVRARTARSASSGTGVPRRASVRARTPYSNADEHDRRKLERVERPVPIASPRLESPASVHLFHYHLVTSKLRQVEARYLGKLGFDLVARHGRIGDELTSRSRPAPPGRSSTGSASSCAWPSSSAAA